MEEKHEDGFNGLSEKLEGLDLVEVLWYYLYQDVDKTIDALWLAKMECCCHEDFIDAIQRLWGPMGFKCSFKEE